MRLVIGRKSYVTNLFWHASGEKISRSWVRKTGQKLFSSYVCWRHISGMSSLCQVGFIASVPGLRWGLPSIAASLADQAPSSWIGAWPLKEGWLVVSVRDNLIEPEGDILFSSERDARQKVDAERCRGLYGKVFVPLSWDVEGSEEIPLSVLLGASKSRLHYLTFPLRVMAAGALAFALMGALAGGLTFYNRQKEMREKERLKEAHKKGVSLVYQEPRLWQTHPRPDMWLLACQESLKHHPSHFLGWKTTGVRCTKQGASIDWIRISSLAETPDRLEIAPQGTTALSSVPFPALPSRGIEELSSLKDNTRFFLIHNLPVTLSVIPEDPLSSRSALKHWGKRTVSLRFQEAPWRYGRLLGQIPGLVFHTLEWSVGSHEWIIEGELYEKN